MRHKQFDGWQRFPPCVKVGMKQVRQQPDSKHDFREELSAKDEN